MKKDVKKIKGWVAKNKGEFDLDNMSFENTKKEAVKHWGGQQEIVKVEVIFYNVWED